MTSLIESLGDRVVGVVESVSANSIVVMVDPSAPQATAFNAGSLIGFPRINGYLLVPNESGATVGVITSIRIERLSYPKRRGMQDFGLIDLPFPARLITLTPLGTLTSKSDQGDQEGVEVAFEVQRGVDVFPSVGELALIPTKAQLEAIVKGEGGINKPYIEVGISPTAAGAPVRVNPDKLFGRHLAVLGNTGAGKSCTVAGLIRWSLEKAKKIRGGENPNARFIVLDPNGEYSKAFSDLEPRVFHVEAEKEMKKLKVPAWLWNGEEWAAFAGAAPGVQRPVLFDAIRRLKTGSDAPDATTAKIRGCTGRYRTELLKRIQNSEHMQRGMREGVASLLSKMGIDFAELIPEAGNVLRPLLENVSTRAQDVESAARSGNNPSGGYWHNDFSEAELGKVQQALDAVAQKMNLGDEDIITGEDVPQYFPVKELPAYVEVLATDTPGRDMSQFVDSLNLRIRGLFAAGPLASIANPDDANSMQLVDWLTEYLGSDQAANGPIAVIDLSLVPSESVHIIVAVLARMIFEAVQRHRRWMGSEVPTVLVLDEAHTFVSRDLTLEGASSAGRTCCHTFERIAREGRKFGLGLVLASQRPSEISPTVLSQCNSFLLHRIVNDRDQDLVKRLVPDGLGEFLRELPSLPSRRAILLGWGAPAPLLVEIRELPDSERPHSPDPAFWDVWTGKQECKIDWGEVSSRWTSPQKSVDNGVGNGDPHTDDEPKG